MVAGACTGPLERVRGRPPMFIHGSFTNLLTLFNKTSTEIRLKTQKCVVEKLQEKRKEKLEEERWI